MVSLPVGLRDHLPERAARLRTLDECFLNFFHRHGYQYIISPLFERLETFERARGTPRFEDNHVDGRQFFRALDPHRGELVAFRPDILPQIARLVGSRLQDWVLPLRFCYSGRVVRADDEPGALTREIFQAGCELIGSKGAWADAEIASLSILLLKEAGLQEFKLDLGHSDFVGGFLERIKASGNPKACVAVIEALKRRDTSQLENIPKKDFGSAKIRDAILELPHLFGGENVLERAAKLATHPRSKQAIREVEACLKILQKRDLQSSVVVDLGEVRGFEYYTGIMIQAFSKGCGHPLLSGGRYDHLLALYGKDLPATGFAADLELILETLEAQGMHKKPALRKGILVSATSAAGQTKLIELTKTLEDRKVRHCFVPGEEKLALELAERGGFRYILSVPNSKKRNAVSFSLLDLQTKRRKKISEAGLLRALEGTK